MGWLFALSMGLQQRSERAIWVSFPPIAAGHAAGSWARSRCSGRSAYSPRLRLRDFGNAKVFGRRSTVFTVRLEALAARNQSRECKPRRVVCAAGSDRIGSSQRHPARSARTRLFPIRSLPAARLRRLAGYAPGSESYAWATSPLPLPDDHFLVTKPRFSVILCPRLLRLTCK